MSKPLFLRGKSKIFSPYSFQRDIYTPIPHGRVNALDLRCPVKERILLQVEHEVSFCTEGSQCFVRGLEDEVCRICVCSWVECPLVVRGLEDEVCRICVCSWVECLLVALRYLAWGILGLLYARAYPGRLADFGLVERLDLGVGEAGPAMYLYLLD